MRKGAYSKIFGSRRTIWSAITWFPTKYSTAFVRWLVVALKRGHVERLVPHHFAGSICGYCRGDILPCAAIFGDVAGVCGVESPESLFKGVAEAGEAHNGGDIDTGHVVIDRAGPGVRGPGTSPP